MNIQQLILEIFQAIHNLPDEYVGQIHYFTDSKGFLVTVTKKQVEYICKSCHPDPIMVHSNIFLGLDNAIADLVALNEKLKELGK